MDWKSIVEYIGKHPGVAVLAAIVLPLLGYGASLLTQVLQGRAALATERLRLRHEIASRWLRSFDEASGRCWDSIRALGHGIPAITGKDGDLAWQALSTFHDTSDEVHTIAGVVGLSCPEKGIGGEIMRAAIAFSDASTRVIASYRRILEAEVERLSQEPDVANNVSMCETGTVVGDTGTGLVMLEGGLEMEVWACLLALSAMIDAAAEMHLFETRPSPTLENARRFLQETRSLTEPKASC